LATCRQGYRHRGRKEREAAIDNARFLKPGEPVRVELVVFFRVGQKVRA